MRFVGFQCACYLAVVLVSLPTLPRIHRYADLSASGRRGNLNDSFHIAFGTKIGKPPTAGVGRKSTSSGLPSHRETMGRASTGAVIRDSYGKIDTFLLHKLWLIP